MIFDLENEEVLKKKVIDLVDYYNYQINTIHKAEEFDADLVFTELLSN